MSRIICCAICGVEQHPDVIEGCWANAVKQGFSHLLVKPALPSGADYAHVWARQEGPVMALVSYPIDIYGRDVGP